jgi:uncharacterized protein
MKKVSVSVLSIILFMTLFAGRQPASAQRAENTGRKLKVLIVDGQNNHGIWPKTTAMMKDFLEQTGLFEVDVERTTIAWQGPHNDNDVNLGQEKRKQLLQEFPAAGNKKIVIVEKPAPDPDFKPDFSKYSAVISNFGWQAGVWPSDTKQALEKFISNGGGLIVVHAADNSFPEWAEFNKMIGLGAWGNRSEKSGPYVYLDEANQVVRDTVKGGAGSHGKQHEFMITVREPSHPITKGMPAQWLHAQDELYDRMRGPGENMKILATAYSDEEKNASPFSPLRGTKRHEPMMITVDYGKGRVFHTPLGHTDYSMECVGFMVMLQRAAEWVATGKVTQALPADFPTSDKVSQRKWVKK